MKYVPDTRNFFSGLNQVEHQDYDVKLPIFYYDSTAMSAICTASTAALRKRLPSPDMHPVELYPGRCLMAFSAFEYRRTDIGPYNEFSISALVSHGRKPVPGLTTLACALRNEFSAYVLHLPVTSERARRGGVEMAGYPKFIADIDIRRDNGMMNCTVAENGRHILSMHGKDLPGAPGKLAHYVLHTRKNGIPLNANLYLNPKQYRQVLGRDNVRIELGVDHPICTELQALDLGSEPLLYQYMPSYEAILFGSKNLIDC